MKRRNFLKGLFALAVASRLPIPDWTMQHRPKALTGFANIYYDRHFVKQFEANLSLICDKRPIPANRGRKIQLYGYGIADALVDTQRRLNDIPNAQTFAQGRS